MKFVIALLVASSQTILIKDDELHGHPAAGNTCVNTNKETGIDEPCNAVGDSAWEPDAPLESPADLGWNSGW